MNTIQLIAWSTAAALLTFSAAAAPAEEVEAGIRQLSHESNYSWESVMESRSPTAASARSPITGSAERQGFTHFSFVLNGNKVEAVIKGRKGAIKTESEWESEDELQGNREWIARRLRTFKAPVAEAYDLLSKTGDLKKGLFGTYSGDLTPTGVRELLLERSREGAISEVAPGATGKVKFWIKKGRLVKYEFQIQGILTVKDVGQEFTINRTTTVEIDKIGSTRVAIPAEAKDKL